MNEKKKGYTWQIKGARKNNPAIAFCAGKEYILTLESFNLS